MHLCHLLSYFPIVINCVIVYMMMSIRANGRKEELSEHDYFMEVARLTKGNSEDPRCKVGACIVSQDGKILSVGYNHMPKNDDNFTRFWNNKIQKLKYVCHAELNAIVNAGTTNFLDCRMYVTRIPCDDCAKHIIQSKIKEVFYEVMEGKSEPANTEKMFHLVEMDGFVLRKYKPSSFSEDRNNHPQIKSSDAEENQRQKKRKLDAV